MKAMKGVVFKGKNRIAIEEVPRPSPRAGEAVIPITATTICGTDVHILPRSNGSLTAAALTSRSKRLAGRRRLKTRCLRSGPEARCRASAYTRGNSWRRTRRSMRVWAIRRS